MHARIIVAAALAASLAAPAVAAGTYYVGTGQGGTDAQVNAYAADGSVRTVTPYSGFKGGVRVATGDVNGDGVADLVTGAGPGGGPHVRVFDGSTGADLRSFFAYDTAFMGGVYVGAGDLDGDGRSEVVTGAGAGGGPHVKVFSGADGSVRGQFFAFDAAFTGGVRVASGDFGGDGRADLVVGTATGGSRVKVFDGTTYAVLADFLAFDANFTGGVSLTTGRFSGQSALFVGAGVGGGPRVKAFSLTDGSLLASFDAFAPGFTGGVDLGFARIGGRDTLLAGMASGGGTLGLFDVGGGRRAGQARFLTPFGGGYTDGLFVAGVAAVPEPATWAQLILGFALAGAARRRGLASARALS